jgi:hypothetical protein
MDCSTGASLRRRRLARRSVHCAKLCLYDLLVSAFLYFDHALIVLFTGLRDTQDVLARGNVGQHYPAGIADACATLVVNVNLRVRGCKNN